MITNFEEITKGLTDAEKKLLPVLIKGFKSHGPDNPIKAPVIIEKVNSLGYPHKLTGARLKKLCNLIRSLGIIPLIATSNGYYVSYDKTEIEKQVTSLIERSEAIASATEGLKKFLL